MKTLIAIPLLCGALTVHADCPVKRPGGQPVLPEGETATAQDMDTAQREAESYRLQVEAYLGCGFMNRRQHYRLQAQLDLLMEQYNQELMDFQQQDTLFAEK